MRLAVRWTAEHIETSRTNGKIEWRDKTVQTACTEATDIMVRWDKPDSIDRMMGWTGHTAQTRQRDEP